MQETEAQNKKINYIIAAVLVVFLFYYSYRYVLKYNAEGTSSTYDSTPFAFQVAKYILLAVLCLALLINISSLKLNNKINFPLIAIFMLLVQSTYGFITTFSTNSLVNVCCLMPVFLAMSVNAKISVPLIEKILNIFLYFAIIYELLQIALYIFFGRLPALGHDTGYITDVRFGGPMDDPNGFALLLSFFIPYVFYKFKGLKKLLLVALLLLFLLLTWSLTGYVAFVGVCAANFVVKIIKRHDYGIWEKFLILIFLSACVVLALCIAKSLFSEQISVYLLHKTGSIEGHLDSWDFGDLELLTFLGFKPVNHLAESSITILLYQGGIIQVLLFYSLCVFAVYKAYKNMCIAKRTGVETALYKGVMFYQTAFVIGSINLPYACLFTNFGVFMIFLLISVLGQNKMTEKVVKPRVLCK